MNLKDRIKHILRENTKQEDNQTVYQPCSRFESEKYKLIICNKILNLGTWLISENGLGLSKIIVEILYNYGTNVPEEKIEEYKVAINLLKNMGKVNDKFIDIFFDKIVKERKFVLINGSWSPVNKLNTNTSDLSELLIDLLFKSPKAKPILQKVYKNSKQGLDDIKPHLKDLLNKYFKGPNTYVEYTKNIESNSLQGQKSEDEVRKVLDEKGFEILYQGGDGDLIDMVFGVDLIVKTPEGQQKTIQVKYKESSWNRSKNYRFVDWVIIAFPFVVYDQKSKNPIEI